MPYDRSAYVRGRRRGGGQRRADFDRPHTDSPHHRDDDGYHERPRRRRYDESVTDHGEPDMNPGIWVPVVGGKEIAPGRVHSTPNVLQDLR